MKETALKISASLLSFCFMELVAYFAHKYVMHGFLWKIHEDHHIYKKNGFFKKNDAFFVIFALPGATLMISGSSDNFNILFWIGLGIALYGLVYILIHEIYIHRRFRWVPKIKNSYLEAVRRAHIDHHRYKQKSPGANYGLLIVSRNYFSNEKQ